MGIFSTKKCPIHNEAYSIGKDYMCQQYYYCKKCGKEARKTKDLESRIEELERKINHP